MTPCTDAKQKPTNNGYVYLTVAGKKVYAHRHAYEQAHGPIPAGLVVRHKCDNRRCINPDHLEVGTNADNTQDMMTRGRHRPVSMPGASNGRSVLSPEVVARIRAIFVKGHPEYGGAALARTYGVSGVQICKIARGEAWSGA